MPLKEYLPSLPVTVDCVFFEESVTVTVAEETARPVCAWVTVPLMLPFVARVTVMLADTVWPCLSDAVAVMVLPPSTSLFSRQIVTMWDG